VDSQENIHDESVGDEARGPEDDALHDRCTCLGPAEVPSGSHDSPFRRHAAP
jgi:hypothetical protein